MNATAASPRFLRKRLKDFHLREEVFDKNDMHKFIKVTSLSDEKPIRAATFHPEGELYAVGSNSGIVRICAFPHISDITNNSKPKQALIVLKLEKVHKAPISCMTWNPVGDIIATGSNDKTIKLMRYSAKMCALVGTDMELKIHNGAVRDITFMQDTSNRTSLLLSGGAGDCRIFITDCQTGVPIRALSGHTGHVLSLNTWGGAMFASGSHDKSIRFWDLRSSTFIHTISPGGDTNTSSPASAVCSVSVDTPGRLLASGHEDGRCMLYDIRGSRIIQIFRHHTAEVRSARLSPDAYYLLTGSFDHTIALTDLQGDLAQPLSTVQVGHHADKVVDLRWHPSKSAFLSTSVDTTASVWALPPS